MRVVNLMIGLLMFYSLSAMTVEYKIEQASQRITINPIKISLPPHPLTIKQRAIYNTLVELYDLNRSDALWYSETIAWASYVHKVPSQLIIAVIKTESDFNRQARSWTGAYGSMQVKPSVWQGVIPYDVYDDTDNILAGAYILQLYNQKCGGWKCAVVSYNVGITNYNKRQRLAAQKRYHKKVYDQLAALQFDHIL